jgi:hypothetical protein
MLTKRLKYLRGKEEKRRGKVFKALMVLRKFFKFCHKIGQRERLFNIERNRAVLLIQNFYRVYLSRTWYQSIFFTKGHMPLICFAVFDARSILIFRVRKVKNLRRVARRESDAAIRIKRSIFMRNIKGKSRSRAGSMEFDPDRKFIMQGIASKRINEENDNNSDTSL